MILQTANASTTSECLYSTALHAHSPVLGLNELNVETRIPANESKQLNILLLHPIKDSSAADSNRAMLTDTKLENSSHKFTLYIALPREYNIVFKEIESLLGSC